MCRHKYKLRCVELPILRLTRRGQFMHRNIQWISDGKSDKQECNIKYDSEHGQNEQIINNNDGKFQI